MRYPRGSAPGYRFDAWKTDEDLKEEDEIENLEDEAKAWAIAEGVHDEEDDDDEFDDDFDDDEDEDEDEGFMQLDGVVVKIPEPDPSLPTVFPPLKEDYNYRWVIRHGPDDYKTGKDYGVRPPMVIHSRFYPALEAFVNEYRQYLSPRGKTLFCCKMGAPLNGASVYRLITNTSFRHTVWRFTSVDPLKECLQ